MVRVGVGESIVPEMLRDFPKDVEIVRVPSVLETELEVDLWILPFARRDVQASFGHLRGVRVMQSLMAGVDWITPWLPRDVVLCDGRGIHDISTSEWVVAAILGEIKRFPEYRDLQREQVWKGFAASASDFEGETGPHAGQYRILADELWEKSILIVGYGSIGSAIEARLVPFGVEIERVSRSARGEGDVKGVVDLHKLLPKADVVVVVVPLTGETRGMFGAEEFALMKPGALLVNAARGPVVDTPALVEALQSGRIRAVLDVTDPEPLPSGHPLWTAPNCTITPHIAGSTPQIIYRAFRFAAEQVRRFSRGEPLENVVGEAGY